jgi:hypothetical protein
LAAPESPAAAAPAPTPPPVEAEAPAEKSSVTLDPVEVTAPREDPITRTIRAQDKQAKAELAEADSHRTGELSQTINAQELPLVSAGLTADKLADDAEHRAAVLEQERVLLLSLRDAKTDEERAALKADLVALRDLRRVQAREAE